MKRFLRNGGLFVALPLLITEIIVRLLATGPAAGIHRLHDAYDVVEHRLAAADTANYLFVGTSRVGAAIRPDTFSTALREQMRTPSRTLRVARGFSTLAVHLEGIEYLIENRPRAFRGSTVLVEAPAGLVEPQAWTGRWARPQFPELLSPHLSPAEMAQLWWRADDPFAVKLQVTASRLLVSARYASALRRKTKSFIGTLATLLTPPDSASSSDVDLQDATGVRTDSVGVALTRKKIIPEMRGWTHVDYDRPPMAWDRSVFATLVETVRDAGGRVAVYTMPLSTPARSVIEASHTLRRDRGRLHDWLADHSVPFLDVDFPHSNADFPDLSHLQASRAGSYTGKIAHLYLHRVED